ncbi:MAG TPA: MFS transporter [Methylomirabilota bacterium]|jgi:EmrB/QacA subfamily drug resistance transporter|nr:MFS transporter [Methylomirabilota bacterium]
MQAKIVKVDPVPPSSPSGLSAWAPVTLASLTGLLVSLDTAVNIAFPAISAAFQIDVSLMQWVVVSYVLTYASLLLGCGRLADLVGHNRVLSWGLVGSALAFLACGLAPRFPWFLAARVLQGLSAACMLAAAPALVTLTVPSERRGRALGIFQMGAAVGVALGPLLGGILVDDLGWRAVYLFRILPASFLLFLAARQPRPPLKPLQSVQMLDLPGTLTLAGSVAGALLALNRGRDLDWTSPTVLALLVGAAGCFAGFLAAERRSASPIVDLNLFHRSAFAVANLLNVLANCAMFAIWLLAPYYLVNTLGYSATQGGVLLMSCPLATALAALVAGRLSDKLGTSVLSAAGLGLEASGLWSISLLGPSAHALRVIAALSLVGFGLGVFQVPNMSFVMGAIPREQQGVAAGMSQMMRTLGVVLGVTGASLLFSHYRAVHAARLSLPDVQAAPSFMPAFQDVFFVAAAACAAACALALLRVREQPRQHSTA